MNLRDYLKELQELVDKNPQALDHEVVYAKDDEGNDFDTVGYTPTLGNYRDREFHNKDWFEDPEEYVENSICLN